MLRFPSSLPDDVIDRLTGLEQLRGIASGEFPMPTMLETLGFRLVEATARTVVLVGAPGENALNPMGKIHGGWAASILDSAMGCAVHATLAPGERFATLELKVNLTRALLPGMEPLTATGTLVSRGRRTAVSEAKLVGADGKTYAAGSSTCMILPPEPAR
ncbi:PaaI family thioesterase [Acuticoccus sp. MNP-M23]|uniref:PaaI family thioesterase n=1 Tax=Acuticoccus sp. MNP-M23 TaxID=3072793 RepID=UPI0028166C3B|nr:PaaI family thioesterase [Acuticoccus sp. MNP-M23]WMS43614.1 PaaI family thioesterase [Acuticoccus sp. MNP-M23]